MNVIVISRETLMPSTAARFRFWATACMAQPSFVRVMNAWRRPIVTPANSTFISSSRERMIVPSWIGSREKSGGKGNASGVQNCCSE